MTVPVVTLDLLLKMGDNVWLLQIPLMVCTLMASSAILDVKSLQLVTWPVIQLWSWPQVAPICHKGDTPAGYQVLHHLMLLHGVLDWVIQPLRLLKPLCSTVLLLSKLYKLRQESTWGIITKRGCLPPGRVALMMCVIQTPSFHLYAQLGAISVFSCLLLSSQNLIKWFLWRGRQMPLKHMKT